MSAPRQTLLDRFIAKCEPRDDRERDVCRRFFDQWDGRPCDYVSVRGIVRELTGWADWTNVIGHRIATATGEDLRIYEDATVREQQQVRDITQQK